MRRIKECNYIYALSSIDYSVPQTKCTTVRPYPVYGNMRMFLNKQGALSNFQVGLFGRQILLALQYLQFINFPVSKLYFPLSEVVVVPNDKTRDKEAAYIVQLANIENAFLFPAVSLKLQHEPLVQQDYHIMSFGHFLFEIASGSRDGLTDLSQLDSLQNVPQVHQLLTAIFNGNEKLSVQSLLSHMLFNNDAVKQLDIQSTPQYTLDKLGKRVSALLVKLQDSKKYKQLMREKSVASMRNSVTLSSTPVKSTTTTTTTTTTASTSSSTQVNKPPPPPSNSAPPPPPPMKAPSTAPATLPPQQQSGRGGLLEQIRQGTKLTFKGT
jgi:hypothetical protein